MSEEIILNDGNKLIADFMGRTRKYESTEQIFIEQLKYHSDWNWIMPVIETINNIYAADTPHVWQGELNAHIDEVIMLPLHTPIKTVWMACVKFITWYNAQTCSIANRTINGASQEKIN